MFKSRVLISPLKTAVRFQSRVSEAALQARQAVEQKSLKLAEDVNWIQQLLDSTEGGGYLVSKAGILGQNVAWGEHDEFSHVNNVVYLKWFETARVNAFNLMGQERPGSDFSQFMSPSGIGPIIRSVELAWRYPIKYPDTITVVHKFLPLTKPDRFELKGVVVSHNAKKVAARIHETVVTVDYDKGGIKAAIPPHAIEAFNERLALQDELAPERK